MTSSDIIGESGFAPNDIIAYSAMTSHDFTQDSSEDDMAIDQDASDSTSTSDHAANEKNTAIMALDLAITSLEKTLKISKILASLWSARPRTIVRTPDPYSILVDRTPDRSSSIDAR